MNNMTKCVVIVIIVTTSLFPTGAKAQNNSIQLWLARYCVSEAGFQIHESIENYSNDCTAIAAVLRNRSQTGRVTLSIMRSYSRFLFDFERTDNHRWLPYLTTTRRIPRGWPSQLPWNNRYRERFIEIFELAGKILRNEVTIFCNPDHWGAPSMRREVLRRTSWVRVDCGHTANDFWVIN